MDPVKKQLTLLDDFHVHLRQGDLMRMVVPQIASGGTALALVMVRPHHFMMLKMHEY